MVKPGHIGLNSVDTLQLYAYPRVSARRESFSLLIEKGQILQEILHKSQVPFTEIGDSKMSRFGITACVGARAPNTLYMLSCVP